MNRLFINGSPNKNGNTARLVKKVFQDKPYDVLNLVDYKVYDYGQSFEDDQFDEIIYIMSRADQIVIGTPLYWHSMSGMVRNFIDRFYGGVDETLFQGKDLYFIFQGASPTKQQLESGEYTMKRFASLYGFNYQGMITK